MFLTLALYALLLGIAYFIITKILIPYKRYRFYRQYGKGYFYPVLGEGMLYQEGYEKHNNMDHLNQHMMDDDQDKHINVVNLGSSAKLMLISPEITKEFYMKQENYVKNEMIIDNLKRFMSNGIVFTEGETWKKSRRIFSKAFHFDYLQGLSGRISDIATRVFQSHIDQNSLEKVNTIDQMQQITGSVVLLSFFGETLENEKFQGMSIISGLAHTLGTLGQQLFSPSYYLFGKGFFELGLTKRDRDLNKFMYGFKAFIREKLDKKIAEIEAEVAATGTTKAQSILAQLVVSKQIDEVSREQLFEDFLTFYLAGMDTTGHLLGMIVYFLTQHKDIYAKLQKEVDSNTDATPHGLSQLQYLNAVIKETLRFYGPGNFLFDRVAIKDHELCGIPIKKGTLVTPYAMCTHRNEKYFENPHVYNPERWLVKNFEKELPAYVFYPFSAGSRNCIGQHLANLESRIILDIFIKTFDFSSPDDYQLKMGYSFLPEPAEPLRIKLVQRQKAKKSN